MTRSCCFMSRLSATMALAPPGPGSLATVVNRCTRSASRSFMAEQGRGDCYQGQDCLSYRFQVTITNSPLTRPRAKSGCQPGKRSSPCLRVWPPTCSRGSMVRKTNWRSLTLLMFRRGLEVESLMSFSLWIWFFRLFLGDGCGSTRQEILPFLHRLCLPCLFLDDGGLAV